MKMKRDNIGLSRYFFVSLLELFEIIIARSPDHRAFDANQLNSALGVSLLLLVVVLRCRLQWLWRRQTKL